jgi:hypothetical protein
MNLILICCRPSKICHILATFSRDLLATAHQLRENPSGGKAALVRCRGNAYYQEDQKAAIGGKYDALELHYYTQTENIQQLRVACSECTFTV